MPASVPGALRGDNDDAVQLDPAAYRTLADFRYLLRRFLKFSESAASHTELTPRQHQALLAIKGFARDLSPTVGDLAERLCIRHHSAVELIDRLADADLVERHQDPLDRRRVFLALTPAAERQLAGLAAVHLEELCRLRPALMQILDRIDAGTPKPE
jgi:DNA-binding MarR family transcriptional regulator